MIGVSLADSETQAVELSFDGIIPTVHAIAEWNGGCRDTPAAIVQRIKAFAEANTARTNRVAVTIDMGALFAQVLPVPTGQAESLFHKHAAWDLAEFHPDLTPDAFITDVHMLHAGTHEGPMRLLSVSVRRDFVRGLQTELQHHGFALHVLDGDQFSVEHFLVTRHPEGKRARVVLLGAKRGRLDISVLLDGQLVDYASWHEGTLEACAAKLMECTAFHGPVQAVFLYGPRATQELVDGLRAAGYPACEALNPFAGLEIAPGNPLATHFLAMPHRFVSAVGAALRED